MGVCLRRVSPSLYDLIDDEAPSLDARLGEVNSILWKDASMLQKGLSEDFGFQAEDINCI